MPHARRPEHRSRPLQARLAPAHAVARHPGAPAGALFRSQPPARTVGRTSVGAVPLRRQIMRDAPRPPAPQGRVEALWRRVSEFLHLGLGREAPRRRAVPGAPQPKVTSPRPAGAASGLRLGAVASAWPADACALPVAVTLGACSLRVETCGDAYEVRGVDLRTIPQRDGAAAPLLAQLHALPNGRTVAWAELGFLGVHASALQRASCPISLHDFAEMRLPVAVRCEPVWRLFDLPALWSYVEHERNSARSVKNPLNRRSFEVLRDVRCVVRVDG